MKNDDQKAKAAGRKPAAKKAVDVVTGGTSGIGIQLIKALLDRGDEVRVIVQTHPNDTPEWKRLPPKSIPYIADIKFQKPGEYETVVQACAGADNVFHLAAATVRSNAPFDEYINSNVIGTENVLKACVEANPGNQSMRFVYISTTAVYGNSRKGEILTEESETAPSGPYGETKLMAEQVIKSFAEVHPSITYTTARVATMYGPYYEWSFFKLFKAVKERKMAYIGSGMNHITLVHVDDVVRAFLLFTEQAQAANKTYNLTDGEPYTLKGLIEKAAELLGVPPPSRSVHPVIARIGAKMLNLNKEELDFLTSDRVVSIDKIRGELGFKPQRSINEAGKEMVGNFLGGYRA